MTFTQLLRRATYTLNWTVSEFFLEMYKKIEVIDNTIVLKGNRDVEYLPLRLKVNTNVF